MNTAMRHDLRINGDGSAAGGLFAEVRINGQGTISGDVECITFECNGKATLTGALAAHKAGINGEALVDGGIKADALTVNGHLVGGDLTVDELKIRGFVDAKGSIRGNILRMEGAANIKADCSAEQVHVNGAITMDGLLNAGQVEFTLHGRCRIPEIGGETITVRKGRNFKLFEFIKAWFMPADFFEGRLTADTIEGDEVYLEATKVRIVRGGRVTIGQGCEVDLVEYAEAYEEAPGAKVRESRKVQ